ncbi:MAG: ABC transporter ATP-binding protein [Lachnospiraceae bacterium]|nr:ABC transporter ATP-binding protein [Lachnospiraceae bacterium]
MAKGIGNSKQFSVENAGRKESHKPQDTGRAVRGLWHYLCRYRLQLFLAMVLTVTGNLLALVGPKLSGKAIDAISLGKGKVDFPVVFQYAGLMIVFYIVSSVFSYLLSVVMLNISRRMAKQMRDDVFHKLLTLPVGYFDTHLSGDIISRVSYDIDVINTSLSTDVVQICASVITVVGSFVMMVSIEPKLILVMLVTIPLSIFYTKYMAGKTRPLYRIRSAKLGAMNGFVEEMVSGQKTIGAYAREEVIVERFDKINTEAVDAYYTADYYSCLVGPTVNFINNLSLAMVTAFGALLYLFGELSLGNISSFVLYSRKFSGPINEAANIVSELQSALAAAERVFRLLEEEGEPADAPEATELACVQGDVEMKGISFGYEPGKTIIKNLSLKAPRGSLIAIVGPTGAGKTTLINLLMRFYDVERGEIFVDGKESRSVTRKSLRKAYAMVLQDTWVFGGTIFENIAYGKEGATMEEVVAVAKAAKIHSYIMRLPEGYQTILTEDGVNISKGQKQLLTIARAMLLDAHMLILDEATSNVDTRTEIQIQKAMRRLMAGKTCFVIAHRLSTIQHADRILVVNQGDIVEQGSHTELMEKKGFYYQMYASQFE